MSSRSRIVPSARPSVHADWVRYSRVPARPCLVLSEDAAQLRHAVALKRLIGEQDVPPEVVSRQHAGSARQHSVEDPDQVRSDLSRQGDTQARLLRLGDGRADAEPAVAATDPDALLPRRDAKAEAAVDARLRRVQDRDCLVPLPSVQHHVAHHVGQDPPAPVARQHAYCGHPGRVGDRRRDCQAEGVSARPCLPSSAVERRDGAVELGDPAFDAPEPRATSSSRKA